MDDWSLLPSRNAVSEPAPNHPSPMTTTTLPARLPARVKRPQPAPTTHARATPRLTRPGSPGNQTTNPGQAPKPQHHAPHRDPACRTRTRTSPFHTGTLTTPGPSWMTQERLQRSRPPCSRFSWRPVEPMASRSARIRAQLAYFRIARIRQSGRALPWSSAPVASPRPSHARASPGGAAADRQVAATTGGCVIRTTRVRRRSRRRRGASRARESTCSR